MAGFLREKKEEMFSVWRSWNKFVAISSISGGGLTLKQCQQKIAKAQGIVVIPSAAGLTYCTGWTTIVEALAFGKPIICVDNPYYPFNIEKEGCGIYVTNNPNDIRDTILKLQNNPHILMNMKKNALRMSLQYNMAVFREELKEIIEK